MVKNVKSLFVIPNYSMSDKKDYDYFIPMGIGYAMSVLKQNGYEYDCINLNHLEGSSSLNLINHLKKNDYDYVFTGGMAGEYNSIKDVVDAVKHFNETYIEKIKTIVGGMLITSEPEVVFNDLGVDYGIIGECEETLIDLLKCIENKGDLRNVDGIIFKVDKTTLTNKRNPKKHLDSYSFPDFKSMGYEEYLDGFHGGLGYFNSITDKPRVYNVVGSRSCPMLCSFCWHYSKYRERSIDNVIKEIEFAIKEYNVNIIYFLDECMSTKKERVIEFCDRMIELRKTHELHWYALFRVDMITDEILKKMKEAGCFGISLGFESYSPVVLKSMKKGITPEQIDKALELVFKNKISLQAAFIFGDVAETTETSNETLEFFKDKCKGQVFLSFIIPFPDSEIYRYCLRTGLIKDKLEHIKNIYNIVADDFYKNMTMSMSDKEFNKMRKKVLSYTEKHRPVVTPLKPLFVKYNDVIKAKCPFCNEINVYNNYKIQNKYVYGFNVLCRNCYMKYYIYSPIKKWMFKHYKFFKGLKAIKMKMIMKVRKEK